MEKTNWGDKDTELMLENPKQNVESLGYEVPMCVDCHRFMMLSCCKLCWCVENKDSINPLSYLSGSHVSY